MIDYKSAGVDTENGDIASKKAYENAKQTFVSRKGKIGEPIVLNGGFAGALDFGDFLLIQNDDGTGTKTEIAEALKKFDTIGEDLVAMVADDAIVVGAETVSITNTFDVPKIDSKVIQAMTESLAKACLKEKIVIPGGEVAEIGSAANKIIWNATAVGVVKKEKFITGDKIKLGDKIIGLKGRVLRSNGFSLARKICEKSFGENWYIKEWKNGVSWGEILLTPSKIFHRLLLENVLGDFESERFFDVHGLVHITGGGIPDNVPRILPEGLGAKFDNLHTPHQAIFDLKELGNLTEESIYKTWNAGTAMMLFSSENEANKICEKLNSVDNEVKARIIGEVVETSKIEIHSKFSNNNLIF
jgi:phosphoribosylformylglycinamidine cyclo-ligase